MKIKCKHIHKTNVKSYKISNFENMITVECLDCGMIRYETIDTNLKGKSESKWFKKNKKK